MKILIVRPIAIEEDCSQNTYNNQGIGLATQLSKLGNECALVYYAKRGHQRTEQIISDSETLTVYHIEGFNIVWNSIYNNNIWKLCKEYDLIQTSEYDQIFSWQLQRKFPNKTVIYHGPYQSKYTWKHNLRCWAFDLVFTWRGNYKSTYMITKSKLAEAYLRDRGFHNTKTVGVGLNPIILEQDKLLVTNELKELVTGKMSFKYLLYVGAISERKNLKFIIEILRILINEKKKPEYKLIIVGGKAYKENNYFLECFELIKKYGLSDNVVYMGTLTQPQVAFLYRLSDVYLLATQYDIFGMVYLEAMYFGIPIVTSMCGGPSLLIKEGETGYIRELGNTVSWVNTIQMITEHPDLADRIKRSSSELIKKHYLWEKLAPKFLQIYESRLKNED